MARATARRFSRSRKRAASSVPARMPVRVPSSRVAPAVRAAVPSSGRLAATIIRLGPDYWLLSTADGRTHHLAVDDIGGLSGWFRLNDRVELARAGRHIAVQHTSRSSIAALAGSQVPGAIPAWVRAASHRLIPPRYYDGTPIQTQADPKGRLVRAVATDAANVTRELVIDRNYGPFEDPRVTLTYLENGVQTYGVKVAMDPNFTYNVQAWDRTRTLSYSIWPAHDPQPHIRVNGMMNTVPGGQWIALFTGAASDPQVLTALDLSVQFPGALERASYFAPLMREQPGNRPDPINSAQAQSLFGNVNYGRREYVIGWINSGITFLEAMSCAGVAFWPVGTILCGVGVVLGEHEKVLVDSALFQRTPVPPPPPPSAPPPWPAPEFHAPQPGGNAPSPFPPPQCGGCLPPTVCLGGLCIDPTLPLGEWPWEPYL